MSLFWFVFFVLVDRVLSDHTCSDNRACVFVDNQCPFPLYIQRTIIDSGINESFPYTVTNLATNKQVVLDITGWKDLPGQRLYAWWQDPIGRVLDPLMFRDKVEINWCGTEPNKMCYNPTAVDYFSLPVSIGPYHSSDCPSVPMTGADNIQVNEIKYRCPTEFIRTSPHGVCLSPARVCYNDPTHPMCSQFDDVIKQCVDHGQCNSNLTTYQVYACSETMSASPQLCAAINRGMYTHLLNNGSDANHSLFYTTSPYNEYAKFIHTGGAPEYAFPYDDWHEDSGYEVCETNLLSVTFCPGSGDISTTIEPENITTTSSCGHMSDPCRDEVEWATTTGSKEHPRWYPDFEAITTVALSHCIEEDMQLYWFCKGESPNHDCDAIEIPCGRVCGVVTPATTAHIATTEEPMTSTSTKKIEWISIAIGFGSCAVLTLIGLVLYSLCKRKKQRMDEQLLGSGASDMVQR
eukprot:96203_1